ncbi:MAG: 23S rRNA (adenine(2030)-N(6))-methyltransferase RlmJ [Pseudomonadota bacterium]
MTYRHRDHAGNFGDVLKHVVLALCLEHLKKKDGPFAYIDTHAGIGAYDLGEGPDGDWAHGVAKVLAADPPAEIAAALAPWLSVVRKLNGDRTDVALAAYPGSPEIAARLMRRQDRLHLCELHEDDSRTLQARYGGDDRITTERRDGYAALGALLPPRERRGLVLVDPPFEHRDEMAHMAEAAVTALQRWPGGTYLFWRPLTDMWASERFDLGLAEWLIAEKQFEPEKILRADLWIRDLDRAGKLAGAGLMIVNPPYTLETDLLVLLPWLCKTLRQDEEAGWRLDGALTEEVV